MRSPCAGARARCRPESTAAARPAMSGGGCRGTRLGIARQRAGTARTVRATVTSGEREDQLGSIRGRLPATTRRPCRAAVDRRRRPGAIAQRRIAALSSSETDDGSSAATTCNTSSRPATKNTMARKRTSVSPVRQPRSQNRTREHGDRPERDAGVEDRVQYGETRTRRGEDRSARDGSYTESNEEVAAGMQLRLTSTRTSPVRESNRRRGYSIGR